MVNSTYILLVEVKFWEIFFSGVVVLFWTVELVDKIYLKNKFYNFKFYKIL